MELSAGVDIGGTKTLVALVDNCGRIHHQIMRPTPTTGPEQVLNTVVDCASHLFTQATAQGDKVIGVGVGTAGQVDFEQGRVVSGTPNIRDWNNVPIRERLEIELSLPVYVDNDVNVIALSEHQYGVAKGHHDVVLLACGTGVGGGVISGGRVVRGAWGAAGELGHVSVEMTGPACNCGMRGCLETFASGPALVQRLVDLWSHVDAHQSPLYRHYQMDPNAFTSRDVFHAAVHGDVYATIVVEQMVTALSVAIVGFIHVFNPTVVILGGGLMADGGRIRDAIRAKIRTMGMMSLVATTDVQLAQFGPESGVIGAASQVWLYRGLTA